MKFQQKMSIHKKIKLCLVDDHQIVIDGIRGYLKNEKDIQLIGVATNANEAMEILKRKTVDIIITDISMSDISGIQLSRMIRLEYPEIKIIALSMHSDLATVSEAIQAGVSGYLLKNMAKEELITAIHKIYNKEVYYSPQISNSLIDTFVKKKSTSDSEQEVITLTQREIEILKMIGNEFSNRKIANELHISERTVEFHRKNLFAKTNSKNIIGLIKYAYHHKLI